MFFTKTLHYMAISLRNLLLFLILPIFIGSYLNISLAQNNIEEIDKVIAVVNDDAITLSEFEHRLKLAKQKIDKNNTKVPLQLLSLQIIQTLVQERVVYQFAKSIGIYPVKEEIEFIINQQARAEGITNRELFQKMSHKGISPSELRKQVALQLILGKIRKNVIRPSITISDTEVEAFMQESIGDDYSAKKPEVNIAHIVIKVDEKASDEEKQLTRKKAEMALAELVSGKEFSDIAARYSEFSDAGEGGILGFRPQDRLPDIYEDMQEKMSEGQISEIMTSSNGYHIIKLIARRLNTSQQVERIRASHILITSTDGQKEKALQTVSLLRQKLDEGENFEKLAKLYSQDGSAKKGGDLGWLYPGDTVSEFESVMSRLQPGEISVPVQSQFGWHIIRVDARETVPLPVDKARKITRRALIEQKSAKEFNEWVEDQVSKAYVRIIKN